MSDQPPRTPQWVKWPAIVLGVLALVFLGSRLLGIEHGPGLHAPDPAPSSSGGGR